MDVLWSPWRYNYIASEKPADGCVFCSLLANSLSDRDNFIVHRAEHNFIVLNIYPYTTGHLMVVPYRHLASPSEAEKPETDEMMDLVRRSEVAIRKTYRPDGLNIGMNLGRSAGAGVADHYHMHVLPLGRRRKFYDCDRPDPNLAGNARRDLRQTQLCYLTAAVKALFYFYIRIRRLGRWFGRSLRLRSRRLARPGCRRDRHICCPPVPA